MMHKPNEVPTTMVLMSIASLLLEIFCGLVNRKRALSEDWRVEGNRGEQQELLKASFL
jgi:hypothetical protein